MVRELVHDPILLARRSMPVTAEDLQIAEDLLDTLIAHKEECVGMAANMIGEHKRIIAFVHEGQYMVMLDPEILKRSGEYEAMEGCLSLLGGPRPVRRSEKIKVRYKTTDMQVRIRAFQGFTAQIIQHEVDHCDGILI